MDGGVVHQDVDATPAIDGGLHDALPAVLVGHVVHQADRTLAEGGGHVEHPLEDIGEHHGGTALAQQGRACCALALRRTGHDGDATVQGGGASRGHQRNCGMTRSPHWRMVSMQTAWSTVPICTRQMTSSAPAAARRSTWAMAASASP